MKLVFVNGPRSGDELEFALPEITVGREEDNTLRVPAAGVSRYHARLCRSESGVWQVKDLGSTNGVKVNRVKIDGEKTLAEGDLIEFGDQMIRVSNFQDTAPHLVFNPIGGDAPAAETGNSAELSAKSSVTEVLPPPPASKSAEKLEELSSLLASGSGRLFDPKLKEKKEKETHSEPDGEPGRGTKRLFSGMFFYVLVGAIAVIGISAAMLAMSPKGGGGGRKAAAAAPPAPFALFFEKRIIARDNVFRFTLLLEEDRLEFTIDDIKSQRHVSRTEKMTPESMEVFRSSVNSSGIWNEVSIPPSPGTDKDQKRHVMIADGIRVRELTYYGSYTPTSFGQIESMISDFAGNYGLQTISLTSEELRSQAERNFATAEDLYSNREARGSNLRDAIRHYRLAVGALEQFSPRPPLWDKARKRLEEAELLRKRKLDNLEVERVRFGQIEDFDGIRNVLLQTMELTEEESREYQIARERLFKLDTYLRGRKR